MRPAQVVRLLGGERRGELARRLDGNVYGPASGLPRSGTSLMMQMLAAGGLMLLTDGQRTADPNNPRGYYEWEKAKSLPREPNCIAEAEGKVVKVISSLLLSLPNTYGYKVIFMERSPVEVVASQAAMIQRLGTQAPTLAPEAMARALEAHLKQVKASLRLRPEMSVCWINHQEVLQNPQRVCGLLSQKCNQRSAGSGSRAQQW
ncbi:MAG: sulfotransferase domain-containing protein [Terriglobia bacterium]